MTIPAPHRRYTRTALDWAVLGFVLYLPCRFLTPLSASYYVDWVNHEWAIGYFGEYFRQHGTMPAAFNTSQLGGLAGPVFYGNLFYPLLGLPSSLFAPGVVIRFCVILVFWAQYRLVSQALLRLQAPLYLARVVACTVIWAIYPLTNLYNRATLTEFVATALLVCALSLLILLFYADDAPQRRLYASGMMFSLTVSAGSHPITAVYGVPMFAAVAALFCWMLRTDKTRRAAILRSTWPWIALALLCMLPWIVAVSKYGDALAIRHGFDGHDGLPRVVLFLHSLDHWLTRFYPIPWDRRVVPGVSLDHISTPYLDSQINLPLLILLVALGVISVAAYRRSRARGPLAAFGISTAFFAFFTWISLSPTSYEFLPASARMIQYAYRAVTYQNLSLLVGVFLVVMALRNVPTLEPGKKLKHPAIIAVAVGCLLLSAAGVIVKWSHIEAIQGHKSSPHWFLDDAERQALINLPASYYGGNDYTTGDLFVPLTPTEIAKVLPRNFGFEPDETFGDASPMKLELAEPTWVRTNILMFPWNAFTIDGRNAGRAETRSNSGRITILVPGGSHEIRMEFRPDFSWRILRTISLVALYGWCLYLILTWHDPVQSAR